MTWQWKAYDMPHQTWGATSTKFDFDHKGFEKTRIGEAEGRGHPHVRANGQDVIKITDDKCFEFDPAISGVIYRDYLDEIFDADGFGKAAAQVADTPGHPSAATLARTTKHDSDGFEMKGGKGDNDGGGDYGTQHGKDKFYHHWKWDPEKVTYEVPSGAKKHHMNSDGKISPEPKNPLQSLKDSIEFKEGDKVFTRISANPDTGEISFFQWNSSPANAFHGYVVEWKDLVKDSTGRYTGAAKELIKAGMVNKDGKIRKRAEWSN